MSKDTLGDRIKKQYEHRCRHYLPRRSYIIIHVGCIRPPIFTQSRSWLMDRFPVIERYTGANE